MSDAERLAQSLDGARMVRYDDLSTIVYAWFGGHGLHAYTLDGTEIDYWTIGDQSVDNATLQEMRQAVHDITGLPL